mmetsp:Transcript_14950/g.37925  ORF Transcript_14950/g.37925 Transcript_14950/m.37925 type:complete len:92 (-) Transcript_14950:411-686(-)
MTSAEERDLEATVAVLLAHGACPQISGGHSVSLANRHGIPVAHQQSRLVSSNIAWKFRVPTLPPIDLLPTWATATKATSKRTRSWRARYSG